jgi:C-terminal processing protease CtpA/Prc
MHLEVQYPSGEKQKLAIEAKTTLSPDIGYQPGASVRYDLYRRNQNVRHRMRMQWAEVGDVVILKFPWFFYDADDFFALRHKIRNAKALIVDLRGNSGGAD